MESFIVNGFSLMLLSFSSYFILSWWVRYKGILHWVPYMNSITLAWILTSYTFLLPDLIHYASQTQVGILPLGMIAIIFLLFTVLGVANNRRLYGGVTIKFGLLVGLSATLLVAVSNFKWATPQGLLDVSIFVSLAVVLTTSVTYIRHLKNLSTTSMIYLLSSVALMATLLGFRDHWDRNFSIFVLCGAIMMQVVGYTVFYLEHMYRRNQRVKAEEEAMIQRRHAEQNRSYFLENFDSVTRLRNQTNLQRKFNKWQESSDQQWLLMLNITNFRQFNNTYGYMEGNRLLKQMADWLVQKNGNERHVFRFENDVFLTRALGSLSQVEDAASKLQVEFSERFAKRCDSAVMGLQICMTSLKCGESLDEHIQELSIARATASVERAVQVFDKRQVTEYHKQIEKHRRIREAVRDGKFCVYYQPKFRLADMTVVSSEALVRMVTDQGVVSPGAFMDYAENSGLIVDIGYQVIEQVFSDIESGTLTEPVSINLSAVQLFHEDFITVLTEMTANYHIQPERVSFEITETAVMKHFEQGVKQLGRIRQLGFKVSLDDFGTGYSSFAYLMHMPIQEIKVDRSLVRDIVDNRKQQILLKTLVNLSRDLQVDLIIEGVETEAQRTAILELGGTLGQGYLFSPPLPIDDFKLKISHIHQLRETMEA